MPKTEHQPSGRHTLLSLPLTMCIVGVLCYIVFRLNILSQEVRLLSKTCSSDDIFPPNIVKDAKGGRILSPIAKPPQTSTCETQNPAQRMLPNENRLGATSITPSQTHFPAQTARISVLTPVVSPVHSPSPTHTSVHSPSPTHSQQSSEDDDVILEHN